MEQVWAISQLAPQLVDLVAFVEAYVHPLPERVQRLISHFGFVRFGAIDSHPTGFDFTDCIYAIVWRLLLKEASEKFAVQRIWNANTCGNMVEALMAIAFFGPSTIADLRDYLGTQAWAEDREVEAAVGFLVEAVESYRQEMVANKIRLLEQMILLVHNICREEEETVELFRRLNNKGMDWRILAEYVANFEAMKLG